MAVRARRERVPRPFKTGRPKTVTDGAVRGHRFVHIPNRQSLTTHQNRLILYLNTGYLEIKKIIIKLATSPAIRAILRGDDSGLKETLRRIDGLWGSTREEALQASLGIGRSGLGGGSDGAMRDLAEAIECAVRGKRDGVLGLDWSVDCPERE